METRSEDEQWITFKYENIHVSYFGCGQMGHGLKDCNVSSDAVKEMPEDALLYSVALKVESNLVGKECHKLGFSVKKSFQ